MAYQTPVTDRSPADLAARNSKAFFNLTDYIRIYENARLTRAWAQYTTGFPIPFTTIEYPTMLTDPRTIVLKLRDLASNIEALRDQFAASIPGLEQQVKTDWEAGTNKPGIDYIHLNQWEKIVDDIWVFLFGGVLLQVCPTLTGDLGVGSGNSFSVVDCINMDGYNIYLYGSAQLFIF